MLGSLLSHVTDGAIMAQGPSALLTLLSEADDTAALLLSCNSAFKAALARHLEAAARALGIPLGAGGPPTPGPAAAAPCVLQVRTSSLCGASLSLAPKAC